MMRRTLSILFAGLLFLSQTLGVAAHCVNLGDAAGHVHSGDAAAHSHEASATPDDARLTDAVAHDRSGHDAHLPDYDLTDDDCTLGFVGVEAICATEIRRSQEKAPFNTGLIDMRLSASLTQPTPPPNTSL